MHPLNTAVRPSSESTIGWWPRLERSMMARRRCPRATPPADHTPAPSGPRAAMASAIRATAPMSGRRPSSRTSPAMPHIWSLPWPRLPSVRRPGRRVAQYSDSLRAIVQTMALRYLPQYERLLMGQRSRNDGLPPPPFVEEVSDGIYAYLQ